jgi:transposase
MEHIYRTGPLPKLHYFMEDKMVYVGVDLHKTQFTVCVRRNGENRFAVYPTTDAGYNAFLKEAAQWQEGGGKVRAAVESTGNTRYFKNRMEDAGISVTVINTLKMKVINESVKKTDKHDAATIVEFLEKDMLPESQLCSRTSEQLRRFLKVRTTLVKSIVVLKNQIHALLTAEGLEDVKGSLQSKKGRQRVLDALNQCENGLVAQPLFETINQLDANVKMVEKQLRTLTEGDRVVELLMTIPGCGEICAWTIRAYTDDIARFSSSKKYVSFAGLAPWVQNSGDVIHHGRITKRGPKELRTAIVQVVMGLRRMKAKTLTWRLMQQYDRMKISKGSGKSIIVTARKIAVIIWTMLSMDEAFELEKMVCKKLEKKAGSMRQDEMLAKGEVIVKKQLPIEQQQEPAVVQIESKGRKKTGVAGEKLKSSA